MIIVYITIIFILLSVNKLNFGSALEYGYSSKEQKSWHKKYSDCGGHRQSPIKINSSSIVPVAIPSIEFIDYHNMLPNEVKLVNNGHYVSLSIIAKDDTKIYTPYIFGAVFESKYIFQNLHFHWGLKNNHGSEHILDNIQYPLEMHLVHRNKKYTSNEEATKSRDGLVVLAVFFELREKDYEPLNVITHKLKSLEEAHSKKIINSFQLISLLPKSLDTFYIYSGSLTTPPCSEVVTWILFPDPILISVHQINKFHTLRNSKNLTLSGNYRLTQPIGKRKIYKRMPNKNDDEYKKDIHMLKKKLFGSSGSSSSSCNKR